MKPQQIKVNIDLNITEKEAKYIAAEIINVLFAEIVNNYEDSSLSYDLLDFYK